MGGFLKGMCLGLELVRFFRLLGKGLWGKGNCLFSFWICGIVCFMFFL